MATIRPARLSDLKDVEYVCRMTAGEDARNNETIGLAVAKTFSTYYICECTDTCFVLADNNDKAVGYILCEPDYKRFGKLFVKKYAPEIYKIRKGNGLMAMALPFPYKLWGRKYPAHLHIDILDEYQNMGYGSKLIESLLSELKKRNVRGVMLTANSDNSGAIRFYKRLGFKTIMVSQMLKSIIMAKNLCE